MNPDEIRAMIDHYSVFPPGDPHRLELLRVVAAAPEELRAYYLAALVEQEKVRLVVAAKGPQLPAGLSTRLLVIPDTASKKAWPLLRFAVPLAIAAAVVLAALISVQFLRAARRNAALKSLAWQGLSLKVNETNITRGTITPAALKKILPRTSFSPEIYNYAGFKLTGYSVVNISGQPAILTQWRRGAVTCMMLQFALNLIPAGTPASGATIHLAVQNPGNTKGTDVYSVTLWPDLHGHCGWAVVLPGRQRYHPFEWQG